MGRVIEDGVFYEKTLLQVLYPLARIENQLVVGKAGFVANDGQPNRV